MSRRTRDLENAHYSPDLIRQYEDPEYARKAAEYERQAKAERARRKGSSRQQGNADGGYDYNAGNRSWQGSNSGGRSGRGDQNNYDYNSGYGRSQNNYGQSNYDYNQNHYNQSQGQQGYSYDDYLAARGESGTGGKHGPSRRRKQPKAPKPKKRYKFRPFKLIRRILLVLLILVVALFAYIMSMTKNLDHVDTSDNNFAINDRVAEDLKDYRNIAILGSDARKGEGYDGSRTDAIIILSINKKTGDTKMISVMRDSYLKIRDGSGNLILDKVTHAHAYGGGVDTVSSLNRSLDLNISEYVVFNWKAVADTVDTLGGIQVNVKKNEIADLNKWGPETGENVGKKYKKITKTGVQTIDGVQATTYCRIRKTSGGDTGRAKRYKKVMSAVLKKAVTSPTKLGTLSKDVMPEIRTNMTQTQLATLMLRMPTLNMQKSISWPKHYYGGLINGVWYAVPTTLESNVQRLHKQAFGQSGYTPTQTCLDISNEIINTTGIQYGY